MAKIIYKEGCEGQNVLNSIEGIEIKMLNGQKALIYPKYEHCIFLDAPMSNKWHAECLTEIQALKRISSEENTSSLLELGSPAARFVRQFSSDRYGAFNLPTLLAAMEICDQQKDINALAEKIEGAEFLPNDSNVWSSCRYGAGGAWVCGGIYGFAAGNVFYSRNLAVPSVLLNLA